MTRPSIGPLVFAVALSVSSLACAQRETLAGRSLNSIAVTDDGQPVVLVPPENGAAKPPAHLSLKSFANGGIGSSGGCNYFMGESYAVDGGVLRVRGGDSGTIIGCSVPLMQQDEWFAKFVQSAPAFSYAGDRVILSGTGIATVTVGGTASTFDATGIVITMVDGTWP